MHDDHVHIPPGNSTFASLNMPSTVYLSDFDRGREHSCALQYNVRILVAKYDIQMATKYVQSYIAVLLKSLSEIL